MHNAINIIQNAWHLIGMFRYVNFWDGKIEGEVGYEKCGWKKKIKGRDRARPVSTKAYAHGALSLQVFFGFLYL